MPSEPVRVIRAADRVVPSEKTPGMLREQVVSTEGFWLGTVQTEPGLVTGWHHHGDHESYIYVLSGEARLEFGPGGRQAEVAGPGEVVVVPRAAIHREGSAAGSGGIQAVVVRVGTGPVVVDVDGPEQE